MKKGGGGGAKAGKGALEASGAGTTGSSVMSDSEKQKRVASSQALELQEDFEDLDDLLDCMYLEDAMRREKEAAELEAQERSRQVMEEERRRAEEVRRGREEEERRGRVEEHKLNRLQTLLSTDGLSSLGISPPASPSLAGSDGSGIGGAGALDDSRILTPTASGASSPTAAGLGLGPAADAGSGTAGNSSVRGLAGGGVKFDASSAVRAGTPSKLSMSQIAGPGGGGGGPGSARNNGAGGDGEVVSLSFKGSSAQLEVPKHLLVTKYDYSRFREERFEFPHVVDPAMNHGEALPDGDEDEIAVSHDPSIEGEEPDSGMLSPELDAAALEASRAAIPFVEYEPFICSPDSRPMPELDSYTEDSKLGGAEALPLFKTLAQRKLHYESDYELTKKTLGTLWARMKPYKALEVLILRNSLITKADFRLPALLYCDLRGNLIPNEKSVCKSISFSPLLQHLYIEGNPLMELVLDARRKLIGSCPRLRTLDGEPIDLAERVQSVGLYGSKAAKANLTLLHWDYCFSDVAEVAAMSGSAFVPERITELEINDVQLRAFHVGLLRNLEKLNLARNSLASLEGAGLEQCRELTVLDVSYNHIMRRDALLPLSFVDKLRTVNLSNNCDPKDSAKVFTDYRLFVIFITRNLAGTNRAPGIGEIDGEPVAVAERAEAVRRIKSSKTRIDPGLYAWQINLISYYGHKQVYTQQFTSNITHLQVPDAGLTWADLRAFPSLEVLDLSGNLLGKDVYHLNTLQRLRLLNLSGNVRLDLPMVLDSLRHTTTLEHINLCVTAKGHKYNPDNTKYRLQVLGSLMMSSPDLHALDTRYVTLDERVAAVALERPDVADRYRFGLACMISALQAADLSEAAQKKPSDGKKKGGKKKKKGGKKKSDATDDDVDDDGDDGGAASLHERHYAVDLVLLNGTGSGALFEAATVQSLRRLDGWGLTAAMCNFSSFVALEEINLSGNQLATIEGMELESLPNLKVLDVSNNQIKLAAKKLAPLVDALKSLECLALFGNPCSKSDKFRQQLVGSLEVMRMVDCKLRVIDTEISIDERLDSWRKTGGSESDVEMLRYKIVMAQQIPQGTPNESVKSLDLGSSGFKQVDVSQFVNLQVLILKDNQLSSVASSGISALTQLRALDLRNNQIVKMDEVAKLVYDLPLLENLGISGNKFSPAGKESTWRHKFLCLLPVLREKYVPLHAIDERPITVAEIAKAWAEADKRAEDSPNFRFRILLLRKMPEDTYREDIVELDLSDNDLPLVDLEGFYKLERMSLANNLLTALDKTNLSSLQRLRALDLSNNKLGNLLAVCGYLKECHALENVSLAGNPCDSDRIKTIAGFLNFMDAANMPLRVLNGKRITIEEICLALRSLKAMEEYEIERLRLHLAFVQNGVTRESMTVSLVHVGIQSLVGLEQLPLVTTLDLSNNAMRLLEPSVLKQIPELFELDLRNNDFPSLKVVLEGLCVCKSLTILYLENCTRSKETAAPRKYLNQVCKSLRAVELLDGMRNPYGKGEMLSSSSSVSTTASDLSASRPAGDSSASLISTSGVVPVSPRGAEAKKAAPSKKAAGGGAAAKKAAGGGGAGKKAGGGGGKVSLKGSMRLHKTKAAAVSKELEAEMPVETLDDDKWLTQQRGGKQKVDWKSTFASDAPADDVPDADDD